jgi:hypothetical protein
MKTSLGIWALSSMVTRFVLSTPARRRRSASAGPSKGSAT